MQETITFLSFNSKVSWSWFCSAIRRPSISLWISESWHQREISTISNLRSMKVKYCISKEGLTSTSVDFNAETTSSNSTSLLRILARISSFLKTKTIYRIIRVIQFKLWNGSCLIAGILEFVCPFELFQFQLLTQTLSFVVKKDLFVQVCPNTRIVFV